MENQKMLEFMNQYADSFLEETRTNGDATEYHANSLKYFGMKMLINAVGKEIGVNENENGTEKELREDNFLPVKADDIKRYGVNDSKSDVVKKHCEYIGDIILGETAVFADPAIRIRNIDRFTKIENVLPGTYEVFITQESVPTKDGKRINASDSLKFLHKEYENMKVASKGKVKTRIYTTMAGIFDLDAIQEFLECEKLNENDTYNEWYQRALKCSERYIENSEYVPFERSAFWSDAFLELQNEEYSREVYRAYLTAKAQYDSLGIEKEILDMEYGGILDNTGAVFGSANMLEEEISCILEMNEDGKVISFEILVEDVELPNFDLVNKK